MLQPFLSFQYDAALYTRKATKETHGTQFLLEISLHGVKK